MKNLKFCYKNKYLIKVIFFIMKTKIIFTEKSKQNKDFYNNSIDPKIRKANITSKNNMIKRKKKYIYIRI